ncbi:MAG: DUF4012 domain-containing protein [Patescibacteria group bacterium]|jgi:hypothetical protein
MNKPQPVLSRKINRLPKQSPHHRKQISGVPQDNVLDLRKTNLAKRESDTVFPEHIKNETSLPIKPPVQSVGFFEKWRIKRQIEKQKKHEEVLQREKQIAQEKALQILASKNIVKKKEDPPAQPVKKEIIPEKKPEVKQLKTKNVSFGSGYRLRLSLKPLLGFVLVCAVMILPFASSAVYQRVTGLKSSVLSLSSSAVDNIKIGSELASEFNFEEAAIQFNNAFNNFEEAKNQINGLSQDFSPLIEAIPVKGEEFKSAKNLMNAASSLSSAGQDLTLAFDIFSKLDQNVLETVDKENPPRLTDIIVLGHTHLQPASEKIDQAADSLEEVDPDKLPADYKDQVVLLQQELPKINRSLKQVLSLSEAMLTILGHEEKKRYLVVFQNNRELRASGGFLGSFGMIDIEKGKVTKIDIPGGGTYDLNGALQAQVASPEPLHLLNPKWQIQDANWWPDWPTSAEKIEWFYNQSDGPTVDGVLALTPDVIEDMLAVTGPVDMTENYGVIIDENNFYDVVQKEAEKKYDETQESKKIIADMTPKLLDNLFALKGDNTLSVMQVFYNALREKNILLYFNDPILEEEMINLGWGGSIKETPRDYLSVINTNIGGGKTDKEIEEIINHESVIQEDGSVVDKLTVTRTHKGSANDEFANILNWDYVRVYVPEGSQLVSAEGFTQPDQKLFLDVPEEYDFDKDLKNISGNVYMEENTKTRINKEFGKTVFGNWISVNPGESVTYTITYKLPFKIDVDNLFNNTDTYSLLVQKQPGSFNSLFYTTLKMPDTYQIKWRYPDDFAGSFDSILDTDKYLGVVLAKQ